MSTAADDTSGPAPTPLLELDQLVKEYPAGGNLIDRSGRVVHAVSGVSLTVAEGSTFGLVGESGCGKTTLGRLMVGLEQPTSGTIRLHGEDIATLPRARRRRIRRELQFMFQDPYASLDPRMRVDRIVAEPLVIQRVGRRQDRKATVASLLHEVGLPADAGGRHAHEFSGGQRQRIGLARAIALHPRLIVFDEPVSALDVSIRSQILNLMRDLQARHGMTYVVISHELTVVRYIADSLGVMYLGKLVETGPSDAVYHAPAHPYTQALIETIPRPDPTYERRKDHAAIAGELPSAVDPPSGCRFRTRCPRAQDLCADQEPALRPFGPGHHAACHFPLQPPLTLGADAGTVAAATGAHNSRKASE